MTIKINMTDEMVGALMRAEDDPLSMAQAVLKIVERDLNSVVPVLWQGRPVIEPNMTGNTCVEVTE